MPAPISQTSSDELVYKYVCVPLAKHICFIHPNFITLACFLLVIPIIYIILNDAPFAFALLLFLVIVRSVLDCLDGAVARQCNKTSKLGMTLDAMNDFCSWLLIGLAMTWMLRNKRAFPIFAIGYVAGISLLAWNLYKYSFKSNNAQDSDSDSDSALTALSALSALSALFHDNTVLVYTLVIVVYKIATMM